MLIWQRNGVSVVIYLLFSERLGRTLAFPDHLFCLVVQKRYLRIAFSATCLIACVLLIVLWVRS